MIHRWLSRAIIASAVLAITGMAMPSPTRANPIPLLAYYYIWFDPGSWDRAKVDLPLLGRYSSSDTDVLRQHVRWAKEAGIDGFIVSWKSTEILNDRLERLVGIAENEDFSLSIIYQGLDFERNPLPIEQVAADILAFSEQYGDHPAFQRFGRPLVIWSGTWEFSDDDIASVASRVRDGVLLLASERQVDDYERVARWVDGNAYYWSSVDPVETPGYQEKLAAMGAGVRRFGGLWVAPAAPGFDARLIGGSRVVDRNGGDTLRREMATAIASSPDAIGLISWNEFSENSHVEPSRNFGTESLEVLAELQGGRPPIVPSFDSDSPMETMASLSPFRLAPILFLGGLAVASLALLALRRASRPDERSDVDG